MQSGQMFFIQGVPRCLGREGGLGLMEFEHPSGSGIVGSSSDILAYIDSYCCKLHWNENYDKFHKSPAWSTIAIYSPSCTSAVKAWWKWDWSLIVHERLKLVGAVKKNGCGCKTFRTHYARILSSSHLCKFLCIFVISVSFANYIRFLCSHNLSRPLSLTTIRWLPSDVRISEFHVCYHSIFSNTFLNEALLWKTLGALLKFSLGSRLA